MTDLPAIVTSIDFVSSAQSTSIAKNHYAFRITDPKTGESKFYQCPKGFAPVHATYRSGDVPACVRGSRLVEAKEVKEVKPKPTSQVKPPFRPNATTADTMLEKGFYRITPKPEGK